MALENSNEREDSSLKFGTPVDFGKSFVKSAIEKPYNGVAQLTNLPEMHISGEVNPNSVAAAAGNMAGMALDFTVMSKGIDAGLSRFGKTIAVDSLTGSALKMSGMGAFYGGVLTPGDHRWKTALIDAGTFGAMGGVAAKLGVGRAPIDKVLNGGWSGLAGGAAHEGLSFALGTADAPKNFDEALDKVGRYVAFGSFFGGFNLVVGKKSSLI